jgi:hypothetical protein
MLEMNLVKKATVIGMQTENTVGINLTFWLKEKMVRASERYPSPISKRANIVFKTARQPSKSIFLDTNLFEHYGLYHGMYCWQPTSS